MPKAAPELGKSQKNGPECLANYIRQLPEEKRAVIAFLYQRGTPQYFFDIYKDCFIQASRSRMKLQALLYSMVVYDKILVAAPDNILAKKEKREPYPKFELTYPAVLAWEHLNPKK